MGLSVQHREEKEMKVTGKTAIVTGAGSGLGRGIAVALAKRHCDLAIIDIHGDWLEETVKMIEPYGVKVVTYVADLSERAQINELPEKILADFEAVDLLFNIAGVCGGGFFSQVTDETFDKIMAVNFFAPAYMMKRFMPHLMTRPEAHIVNMASVQAVLPFAGDGAYSASKFALRGLTEAIDCELYDNPNIHLTYVIQGGASTGIVRNAFPTLGLTPEEKAERAARYEKFNSNVLGADPFEAAENIIDGTEQNLRRIVNGTDAENSVKLEQMEPVDFWPILRKKLGR